MPYSSGSGLNVNNQYGQRDTGGSVGVENSSDSLFQLSINITGDSLNTAFLPPVVVPKGAHFLRAVLRVDEAFALTGTTPAVSFGSLATEATNGISLSKAELEAIGTKIPASTGAGTWAVASATGLAAAAKVGKVLTGTTPAVTAGIGRGTLVLEFINKTKI